MYEIGKTQSFKFFLKRHKDSNRHADFVFSFDILKFIKTFRNITICKVFILKQNWFGIALNKFAIWIFFLIQPMTITHPT